MGRDEYLSRLYSNSIAAAIKINNGTATVRPHLTPSIPAGENTPVYIGGSPPWHRSEDDSTVKSSAEDHPDTFQGVISVVAISGEPKPFDDVARPVQVEPFNACHKSPCLNGGRCRTTSNFVGYSCKCEDGFEVGPRDGIKIAINFRVINASIGLQSVVTRTATPVCVSRTRTRGNASVLRTARGCGAKFRWTSGELPSVSHTTPRSSV